MLLREVTVLTGLCSTAAPAYPHHSYAGIDRSAVVEFVGTVIDFGLRNPRAYIHVETGAPDFSGYRRESHRSVNVAPVAAGRHPRWARGDHRRGSSLE